MSLRGGPLPRWRVRPPEPAELSGLPDIERAAAAQFDRALVPDPDQTRSIDELRLQLDAGLLWVAAGTEVMGFLLASREADELFIEEVDVHPRFAGHRLGAALIRHACAHAHEAGLARVTLTTFAHVPWNAPYYGRLGFRVLDDAQRSPALRRALAREAAAGLSGRVAMARPCTAAP